MGKNTHRREAPGAQSWSAVGTIRIAYGGQLVAYALEERVLLLRPVAVLELDHPVRRFVALVALVAREMENGLQAEGYTPWRARWYARRILMPQDDFLVAAASKSDVELAEYFNVPLGEVVARREDLRQALGSRTT
jgi:hypothetical protein